MQLEKGATDTAKTKIQGMQVEKWVINNVRAMIQERLETWATDTVKTKIRGMQFEKEQPKKGAYDLFKAKT